MNEQFSNNTRWKRAGWGIAPIVLAALILGGWLLGMAFVLPAGADAGILYVDKASGVNAPACGSVSAPCKTITYAITNRAVSGTTIRIAQGTYFENLDIGITLTLEGGYSGAPSWTRDLASYETILDGQGQPPVWGDWDEWSMYAPAVIEDNGTYKMWYTGFDLFYTSGIGYATSPDGIQWTRAGNNPVLSEGDPGAWDAGEIGQPNVLKQGGQYKMWYFGADEQGVKKQIGYATSSDGVNWTKYAGNPVLTVGAPGEWDESEVGGPRVIFDGVTYHLWYHGYTGECCDSIGYATSTDGIHWTKYANNPVFGPGAPGEWDDTFVFFTALTDESDHYNMWYSVGGGKTNIGFAASLDGIDWTRSLDNPVLTIGDPGSWDEQHIFAPTVVKNSGLYHMWYSGYNGAWDSAFGYATSLDGISWTKSLSNPVFLPGAPTQWDEPVIRFQEGTNGSVLDGLTIRNGWGEMAGGVFGSNIDLTIRNCTIHGNNAGGLPQSQGGAGVLGGLGAGTVRIENSRIVDNEVIQGAGGVRVHQGGLILTNTLIGGNRGDAGIHVNGPLSLMHVTVADNDGGVIFNPPAGVLMNATNSIVYFGGGVWTDVGVIQISYSDIEGGFAGVGNQDVDPQFVDMLNGDYHLLASSPVIDAGTPAGSPPFDLDGVPRDVAPDMGAFENQRFDHDLAVIALQPLADIAINVPTPIRATIFNAGLNPEGAAPVTCEISQGGTQLYQQSLNTGALSPLAWQVLDFPAFTPTALGDYDFACTSNLAGDGNPANDTYSRTLTVVWAIAAVWTKDNLNDTGDEPSDLNSWYESPDLWVRNDDDGGLIHQDPIMGVTNTVYIRLRNRGTVPISGTVDAYWIEPSVGVRCGDWAYIDTVEFSDLLPGETRIVSVPWIPTRTGHTCLQDVIDSPLDPYNRALECSPLWVPWDNNVEWHNVNIIANPESSAHGVADVLNAQARLANVYNLPKDVDLIIERRTFPATGEIILQLPAELFDRWQASAGSWSEGIEVLAATKEIKVTGAVSATIGGIPLEAAEEADLGLALTGQAGLDFEMAIREVIDQITVGGVAYQWRIPDTTPPTVVSTTPADEAAEVSRFDPLVIVFDEPVSPLNFVFNATPDPGGWVFYWNEDSTVVTAAHRPFAPATDYNFSVDTTDASLNAMVEPYEWAITSEEAFLYLPIFIR